MTQPAFLFVLPHAALPLQAVGVTEHLWPAFQQHELFGMAVGKGVAYRFEVPASARRALAVMDLLFEEGSIKPDAAVQRFGSDKLLPPAVESCSWWTGSTHVSAFLSEAATHLGVVEALTGDGLRLAVEEGRQALRGSELQLAPPPIVRSRIRVVGWSLEPVKLQLSRFALEVVDELPRAFDGLQLDVPDGGGIAKLRGVARQDKLGLARTLVDNMRRLVVWAPYGQALRPVRGQGLRTLPGAHQSPPFLDLELQWPTADLPPAAGPRESAVQQILAVLAELPVWEKLRSAEY